MKIKIPIIGKIQTGKDIVSDAPSIVKIESPKTEKTYDVLGGFLSFSRAGLSNEKTISSKLLDANKEWVYRNNDVIAQEVSKIQFELYSIGLKDGLIVYTEIQDHKILDLLDKFNSSTTKIDGLYMTQSHKKLTGDAFWLLDKNGNTVENIFVLPPDKIELMLTDPTDSSTDIVSSYKYEDVIDGKKISKEYDSKQIIHFKKPNPKNPFRGYGAVEAIADTIDADNITNETQRNFFDKGAISNFVLTTDNKITQDQLKRIRAELRAMYTGSKNAYTTMIFGNGLKPTDIGFSNKDMQFLDLLTWYRDKIMLGFGNTKASLGIIDDVNRASFQGSYNGWLRSTVRPDMDAIVNTLNEFLVPLYGDNLVLGYKDPIPQDITDDVNESVQLKNAGVMTINEAREKVGLDPVPGGDIFEPLGLTSLPNNGNPGNPENQPVDNPKIFRKPSDARHKNLPSALKHIDIERVLRNRGIYFKRRHNQELKELVKPLIRKQLNRPKKVQTKTEEPETSTGLSQETIDEYYKKQVHLIDSFENQFLEAVLKLLTDVKNQTISNLESEVNNEKSWNKFVKKKELFDEEALVVQAQIDLTPLLMQELVLAGQEAMRLIGSEDIYTPFKVKESIKKIVDKFAKSMLETDKKKLTKLIADGLANGDSIGEISNQIESEFTEYTKMQADRIARTEIARVANMAAEDAFIQSGVVEAKQWLTAPGADAMCIPYSGKIVKLGKDFYSADSSGFQDGNPPIHPSCRCILIPVVAGEEPAIPDQSTKIIEVQQSKIAELEATIDKRKKEFKDLKKQHQTEKADDAAYIKALEKYTGVSDEES